MLGMPLSNEGFSLTIGETTRLNQILKAKSIRHSALCSHCLENLAHMTERQAEQEEAELVVLQEAVRHASTGPAKGSRTSAEAVDGASLRRREELLRDTRQTIEEMNTELKWLREVGIEWCAEERAVAVQGMAADMAESRFQEDLAMRLSQMEAMLSPAAPPVDASHRWVITNDDKRLLINGHLLPSPKETSSVGADRTGWSIAAVLVAQAQALVPPSAVLTHRVLPLAAFPRVLVTTPEAQQRETVLDFHTKGGALNTAISAFEAAVFETATVLGKPLSPASEGFGFFDQRWSKNVRARLAEGLRFLAAYLEEGGSA